MLKTEIEHFLTYCKVSDFSGKSIETFTIRLNEFNEFLKTTTAASIKEISYKHLRRFVADFKTPSVHIKKARIWTLHQFFHFLKLNGLVRENMVLDIPYPKIEKTVPHFLTIDEYNRILQYFLKKARDFFGLRNLVIIMMLGLLGLRLGSMLSLNIDDVDIETGLLRVIDKGRKGRTLIMPGTLCRVLSQYLQIHEQKEGPLFLSKRKKRISLRTLQIISMPNMTGNRKHQHISKCLINSRKKPFFNLLSVETTAADPSIARSLH